MMTRGKTVFKWVGIALAGFSVLCVAVFLLLAKPCNSYGRHNFQQIDTKTVKLANHYMQLWNNPELRADCLAQLHRQNPEWDFMFRTYCVLAFANLALHEPARQQDYASTIDLIIQDTLQKEQQYGFRYFLLPYGQGGQWNILPGQSLFVDGEIALMEGARCLLTDHDVFRNDLKRRVATITNRMRMSPVLCGESYPDECWIFCNSIALAAITLSDQLNGTDHQDLCGQWTGLMKAKMIDPQTGLLRSAFRVDGTAVDSARGPEGSSIWMSCHMLQLIDTTFAQDQYTKAKNELFVQIMGFGFSREWPKGWQAQTDIDSGMVVPFLNASPSASGLAIVAAAAFKDADAYNKITRSLNSFAFPKEDADGLHYGISNPLGDAVFLYGFSTGPLWEKAATQKMSH